MNPLANAERCVRRLCDEAQTRFKVRPTLLIATQRVPRGSAVLVHARPDAVSVNVDDLREVAGEITLVEFGPLRVVYQA